MARRDPGGEGWSATADPTANGRRTTPLVATGFGGRVELWETEIRIIKNGIFWHLVELLGLGHGMRENTLFLDEVASVNIVRSMFLPAMIRFSYAGARETTGEYWQDALAENALVMNLFDNRNFFVIRAVVEDFIIARRARPILSPPNGRRRQPPSGGRAR